MVDHKWWHKSIFRYSQICTHMSTVKATTLKKIKKFKWCNLQEIYLFFRMVNANKRNVMKLSHQAETNISTNLKCQYFIRMYVRVQILTLYCHFWLLLSKSMSKWVIGNCLNLNHLSVCCQMEQNTWLFSAAKEEISNEIVFLGGNNFFHYLFIYFLYNMMFLWHSLVHITVYKAVSIFANEA